MSLITVYKTFRIDPEGRLCSALIEGPGKSIYPKRMHYGKKWLTSQGYWPIASATKEAAYKFISSNCYDGRRWELWECVTPKISTPTFWCLSERYYKGKAQLIVDVLRAVRKDTHWPVGTVFCHGIRPVIKIDEGGK